MWKKELDLSNGKKLTVDTSGIGAREFRTAMNEKDIEKREDMTRAMICKAVGVADWEGALDQFSEYDLRVIMKTFWDIMNAPFS